MENYSVLMSVYIKEIPDCFVESIESMLNQTVCTNDFVIVCDGTLTQELDAVIERFRQERPDLFQIVRLTKNLGIGGAANAGISCCKNDLVAKMDSDDIACLDRCEKQLALFSENLGVDIVGGQLAEFMGNVSQTVAIRSVPLDYNNIFVYAKRRMPFNNQTVMYRKKAVEAVGGYRQLRRCEDYDLYTRMLQNGSRALNSPDILVNFRLNDDAYKRRGMKDNLTGFVYVRWDMYRRGFSSFLDFLIPSCGQVVLSIAPNCMRDWMYKKLLREQEFNI